MNDNYTHKEQEEEARKTEGKRKEKKRMHELCFLSNNNIIHLSYFLLP
jgi:hypothetical protein